MPVEKEKKKKKVLHHNVFLYFSENSWILVLVVKHTLNVVFLRVTKCSSAVSITILRNHFRACPALTSQARVSHAEIVWRELHGELIQQLLSCDSYT